jgi:cell division protein FtsB
MPATATAPRRKPAASGKPATKKAPATRAERNSRALANARATKRATATAAPATRPRTAPARRKSGPAAKPRSTAPSPVARVLTSRGMPLVDRILRGPVWVVMLGALLAGIVFLNVSVLELNRGIAATDAKSAALERKNSTLREKVAKLDSGARIQQLAAARGYVMPQPGDVTFVRPRRSDAKLAAQRITPPADATVVETTAPIAPVQAEPVSQVTPTTQVP